MKKDLRALAAEQAATVLKTQAEKRFPHLLGDVDRPGNVAMYYGFTPVKTPSVTPDDLAKAKPFNLKRPQGDESRPSFSPEEKIAILRTYSDNDMGSLPQPVMLYYRKPLHGAGRKNPREVQCALDAFGAPRSSGEALVIQAAYAMLADEGFSSLSVELNSVGDRDSITKHDKELCLYLRKHAAEVPAKFRSAFKANPHAMLSVDDPDLDEFRDRAPKSVSALAEPGRRHFMEVLEFLETLEIPYRINHTLLGNRGFGSHVIFEIRDVSDESKPVTLAYGFRYNQLSKKLGFKKELPSVGVSIRYRKPEKELPWKPITNPKFYFVQFGQNARLKALPLIEMLRRERISVYHSITKDKLIGQMSAAENLKVPYVLIMGQKEALEGTVVVRDMNTRAQETVAWKDLPHYLKKLR